jgi:hypothetical protein
MLELLRPWGVLGMDYGHFAIQERHKPMETMSGTLCFVSEIPQKSHVWKAWTVMQ